MIEAVVAPLLHNRLPAAFVERTELPQLFTTVTTGVDGVVLGTATPLPGALVQPLLVVVTVYVAALLTVIVDVVAPVLHNRFPAALVESVEAPLQLFTTVTKGAAAVFFGAAVPLPGLLLHPFIVAVTV